VEQTTTLQPGTASVQGELWGSNPDDWASLEAQQAPVYEAIAERAGIKAGSSVLDVGCGTGTFLAVAAERGAGVSGIDASAALVELARERVPSADVCVGELQVLPWEPESFDVVTGFNAFQFAGDMVEALREARRVTKPGGKVVVQVWGRAERCDLTALNRAIAPFVPNRETGPSLAEPGVLEALVREAGLTPIASGDVRAAFVYESEESMLAAMLSPGPVALAVRRAGPAAIRDSIRTELAQCRTPDGGYQLWNDWHYLLTRA
jgi:SAM-dependent methyltransferase